MSFNSTRVNPWASGTLVAFTAPLAAFSGSKIALNTLVAGSVASTAGLVLNPGGANNVEFDSLVALVETNLTTNTITVGTKWQATFDGTNWLDVFGKNAAANVTKAAAGTGVLVTTQYLQAFDGLNPAFQAIRLAAVVGVATGAAGDNVTVAYAWRKRFVAPIG